MIIFVSLIGNSGPACTTTWSPADSLAWVRAPRLIIFYICHGRICSNFLIKVIAVGATIDTNGLLSFSKGPTIGGRPKPDISGESFLFKGNDPIHITTEILKRVNIKLSSWPEHPFSVELPGQQCIVSHPGNRIFHKFSY